MPEKHKILITGSSGMLGVDLCRELRKEYELIGADLAANEKSEVAAFIRCDITDGASVSEVFARARPDIVIHAAAWTDVDGCELDRQKAYKVNFEGTQNIVSACKRYNAILIYLSTDFVFDGKKTKPYKETDKPKPLNIYSESKLKGEEAVKKNLKRYIILRTSWLYGRNGKNFVDTIIAKAKTEKALKVVDDQVGSPTYTIDLAAAIHALLSGRPKKEDAGWKFGIYHISNSGSVSWCEYAREILKLARSDTKVVPFSSKELNRPAKRPAMSVLDNSKFTAFTGYKMRPWKDALKDYLR